jgi:hypothetical protein
MATMAPAPWSEGFRRFNKKQQQQVGATWSLESGYGEKAVWDKQPKKPDMKRVKLYNGKYASVPAGDYEEFIGFSASPDSDPDSDVAEYIDTAIWSQSAPGVGHIENIEYAPMRQLLSVKFSKDNGGAEVVFFRVPKEVYSELKYLAESGSVAYTEPNGTVRHTLGVRFWDIVRIRGSNTQARYRFEYLKHSSHKATGFETDLAAAKNASDGLNVVNVAKMKGLSVAEAADKIKTDQEAEDIKTFDTMAKNMLTGARLDGYKKQKTYEEKAAYLHKERIL